MSIQVPEGSMQEGTVIPWEVPDRPPFGTRDWWLQQPELAVTILMLWRDRQPAQFGSYLAEALTGTKPRAPKGQLCGPKCFTTAGNGSRSGTIWTPGTAPTAAFPSTATTASAPTGSTI